MLKRTMVEASGETVRVAPREKLIRAATTTPRRRAASPTWLTARWK